MLKSYLPCVEMLEARQFLSVTAAVAAGPLTKGSTFTYETFSGKNLLSTRVDTVIGPTTFNGHKVIEVDQVTKLKTSTQTNRRFEQVDAKLGFVAFGRIFDSKSATADSKSTTTSSPNETDAPPAFIVGKTYTFKWTDTTVKVITPGNIKSTTTTHTTVSEKLLSNTPQLISVPAGKFKAYEIDVTATVTVGTSTTVIKEQIWVAAGVGVVKAIQGTAIIELSAYKVK